MKRFLICLLQVLLLPLSNVLADPFSVPKPLAPRVQFWLDVFAKHSTADFVVHHRMFPQAIFMEVTLEGYRNQMSPVAFDVFKKRHEKQAIAEVKEAVRNLSLGNPPRDNLERRIVNAMAFIPGGRERYADILREDWIRTQTGIREKTELALQRGALYLPIIQQIFAKEYGLPTELTVLPIIESSFDYKAYSSVGAAGIWQLMPATARQYGLKVTNVVDERRDVVESTRAAAKYLRDAYRSLESWPLAITSYNHGIGGVRKKVREMGSRDISYIVEHPKIRLFGFASNNFYPEFLAALEIDRNKRLYFPNLQLPESVYMTQVTLPQSYSLRQLATNLGIDQEVLTSYNYGLLNPVLKGAHPVPAGYKLKVPNTHADQVKILKSLEPARSTAKQLQIANNSSQIATQSGSAASAYQIYQVGPNDTLSGIAARNRVTTKQIMAANGLRSSIIKVGQKLKIPMSAGSRSFATASVNASSSAASRSYVVKRGDTLWRIARNNNSSIERIKSLNGLKNNNVKVGQKLLL